MPNLAGVVSRVTARTAMPRNAAVAAPSSTSASSSYRNRRIRFRRDRNQLTAYSAIAIRSKNAQDITESPRIASADCVGLSRGSLDGANLGRFVSNSRTRVLTILGKLRTSNPPQRRAC